MYYIAHSELHLSINSLVLPVGPVAYYVSTVTPTKKTLKTLTLVSGRDHSKHSGQSEDVDRKQISFLFCSNWLWFKTYIVIYFKFLTTEGIKQEIMI